MDTDEHFLLAELLSIKKKYDASATEFVSAFGEGINASNNFYLQYGYAAARAAVQAGCGDADDGSLLSDAQKTQRLTEALHWLELTLSSYSALFDRDADNQGPQIKRILTLWLNDPDLASVRDEQQLAKLPRTAQEQWEKLWNDVKSMITRPTSELLPAD